MTKEIALIGAVDNHRVIGRNNGMLWHLPEDMKWFRRLTKGHPLIMGRQTFRSIGKPLPGRLNIVMSRDAAFSADGTTAVRSVEEALAVAGEAGTGRICVIGGAQVYRLFLPLAHVMYLTHLRHIWDGDTTFPAWDERSWNIVWRQEGATTLRNPFIYEFCEYRKAGNGSVLGEYTV